MTRLLAIEWMKVRSYRTFWVLVGLFAAVTPLLCMAFEGMAGKAARAMPQLGGALAFPRVFENIGWLVSYMTPVMGILVIILISNEKEFRTLRQNVIDGWSRGHAIAAKFGVMLCLVLFITLAVAVPSLIYGWERGGVLDAGALKFLAWSALQSLAYLSFAFFLGVFLKRSGIAIALYVFYACLGEFVLASLLDFKVRMHVGAFLPLEATDRLLPGELKMVRGAVVQQMGQGHAEPTSLVYVSIAAAYILLFCFLSWRRMKRMDL